MLTLAMAPARAVLSPIDQRRALARRSARGIGERLALSPGLLMRSVVTNGAAIAALGLLVGLLGAAALTRLLGGLLYETAPLDVGTFVAMPLLLFIVALIASYLPARKPASVSPLEAMRGE